MKYFLLLNLFSISLFAETVTNCGEYTAKGIVRKGADGLVIVVNEKTKSEHVISLPILEQAKLGPFIDRPLKATLVLTKPFNGTKGYSSSILSADDRIPDPLNPEDTGLILNKKLDCQKD
jgi:hypothetical protein